MTVKLIDYYFPVLLAILPEHYSFLFCTSDNQCGITTTQLSSSGHIGPGCGKLQSSNIILSEPRLSFSDISDRVGVRQSTGPQLQGGRLAIRGQAPPFLNHLVPVPRPLPTTAFLPSQACSLEQPYGFKYQPCQYMASDSQLPMYVVSNLQTPVLCWHHGSTWRSSKDFQFNLVKN